jgi:hypothetical protein
MCSDHVPLLLRTDHGFRYHKRLHFQSYWPKFPSFEEVVRRAWHCPFIGADPYRRLDWLLRNTVRSLKSWSDRCIGNIRSKVEITKEVVHCLELAGDHHRLHNYEDALRKKLKMKLLGLCSLQRTVVRQESQITWLREGDACTKFFHANANGRRRKNHIHALEQDRQTLLSEESKAEAAFNYF